MSNPYTHPDPVTPVTKHDPIVQAVMQKLYVRSQAGIIKYGTTLERTDLSRLEWLNHAQQEALDLANYLEVLIQQEITLQQRP